MYMCMQIKLVQTSTDVRGYHFQNLLQVHSDFPNTLCMYVCVYIYIYIYIFVCVCVCVCICMYIQGVTGRTDQTSGECSLVHTIPI